MDRQVIIIGTGGHAKVVTDIINLCHDEVVGYLTTDQDKSIFLGKPVLGDLRNYVNYRECEFIVAIGHNESRKQISQVLNDVKWYTAIHPSAIISYLDTSIGKGTVIGANAVLNGGSKVGNHCILNTGCIIEHEDIIGDYVHVSVGVKLAGRVVIEELSFLGIGSTCVDKIHIKSNIVVGAGSVVTGNLEKPGVYLGIPARLVKSI